MMEYPLVTIVTCTYNKFETILVTIGSVLSQDYPRIEYIITDDGSKNFPYDKIYKYIEYKKRGNLKSFNIIRNEKNLGTVKNINGAYRSAKGKYIMALSGDDVFFSNSIVSKIIEEMQKKNSTVMVTSRIACDQDFNPQFFLPHYLFRFVLKKYNTSEKQHDLFISGQHFAMASGSAMCIKKGYFDKYGYFDERYILWEDGPFLESYLRKNKIDMSYDIVSIRYQLNGISTSGHTNDKLDHDSKLYDYTDRLNSISKMKEFYKKLTLYNIRFKSLNNSSKIKIVLQHPIISAYKLFYKVIYLFAEHIDHWIIKNKIEGKYASNKIHVPASWR